MTGSVAVRHGSCAPEEIACAVVEDEKPSIFYRLPSFHVPPMKLIMNAHVILWSVIIAVVSFANSFSMAKLIARKYTYEVRPNQELLALVRILE